MNVYINIYVGMRFGTWRKIKEGKLMSTKSFTTDFSFNTKGSDALVTAIEHSKPAASNDDAKKTLMSLDELKRQLYYK